MMLTWKAFHQLMVDQVWPASPTTGAIPVVYFGVALKPEHEAVVVVGTPEKAASEARVTNRSVEEQFVLQLRIVTELPGRTADEAFDRLGDLLDVAQGALRDPATGRQTNTFCGQTPSYPVPGMVSWLVDGVRSQMYLTAAGVAGYAELDVLFKSRI